MITGVDHCGGVWYPGCPQSPASVCWLTQRAFTISLVFFIQWLGEDFQVRKHLWVLAVLGKPPLQGACMSICSILASVRATHSSPTPENSQWFPLAAVLYKFFLQLLGRLIMAGGEQGRLWPTVYPQTYTVTVGGQKPETQWSFLTIYNKFYVSKGLWVKPITSNSYKFTFIPISFP